MSKYTVPEAAAKLREYYALPENSAGGAVHIIVEDGNVSQGDADWCLRTALEHGDSADQEIALMLAMMSRTQRKKLSKMNHAPRL